MTPKQVRVMAEYLRAAEALADATDDLIKATQRHAGLMSNFAQFEEVALIRLKVYRQARADYEAL